MVRSSYQSAEASWTLDEVWRDDRRREREPGWPTCVGDLLARSHGGRPRCARPGRWATWPRTCALAHVGVGRAASARVRARGSFDGMIRDSALRAASLAPAEYPRRLRAMVGSRRKAPASRRWSRSSTCSCTARTSRCPSGRPGGCPRGRGRGGQRARPGRSRSAPGTAGRLAAGRHGHRLVRREGRVGSRDRSAHSCCWSPGVTPPSTSSPGTASTPCGAAGNDETEIVPGPRSEQVRPGRAAPAARTCGPRR